MNRRSVAAGVAIICIFVGAVAGVYVLLGGSASGAGDGGSGVNATGDSPGAEATPTAGSGGGNDSSPIYGNRSGVEEFRDEIIGDLPDNPQYPPGSGTNGLEIEQLLASTVDEAKDSSWVYNVRIIDNGSYHSRPYRITSKYNWSDDRHAHAELFADETGIRYYSEGENGVIQYVNTTAAQQLPRDPITPKSQIRPGLIATHLSAGFYEPTNSSVVKGYRTFLFKSQGLGQEAELREYLDAQDVIAYDSRVWVGEDGIIHRAVTTALYEDQEGVTRFHKFEMGLAMGGVDFSRPEWVNTRTLSENSTAEIVLVDNEYVRLSPRGDGIPEDSRIILETPTGTYREVIPAVSAGGAAYLTVVDGELQYSVNPPERTTTLGSSYTLTVVDDGQVIMRKAV